MKLLGAHFNRLLDQFLVNVTKIALLTLGQKWKTLVQHFGWRKGFGEKITISFLESNSMFFTPQTC